MHGSSAALIILGTLIALSVAKEVAGTKFCRGVAIGSRQVLTSRPDVAGKFAEVVRYLHTKTLPK
jgi:hypothetical protein